jgi:Nineteen complex-related protein 2
MASPSLFASRRKPKRMGREPGHAPEDDDNEGMTQAPCDANHSDAFPCRPQSLTSRVDTGPVVRKPTASTPRTKSKLRLSFNPAEAGSEDQQQAEVLKKRPAPYNRPQSLLRESDIPSQTIDRPSYSKDYLSELRNSTPTTPKDLSAYTSSAEEDAGLDVASKFGSQSAFPTTSHIPSALEISEKKRRRARLAKEQGSEDFIALDDYDSDGEFKPQRMQISTFLDKSVESDTRLIHDDEDMAEGFESFVDDPGKVTLSRRARREAAHAEKESIRSLIAEAEDSSDESDSSAERNHAYETAQTSRGMDGLSLKQKYSKRPQEPKEITPIPKLGAVLTRFQEGIQGLEFERRRLEKRRADIREEKAKIAVNEEHIQKLLVETGERYERSRREAEEVRRTEPEPEMEGLEGTEAQESRLSQEPSG